MESKHLWTEYPSAPQVIERETLDEIWDGTILLFDMTPRVDPFPSPEDKGPRIWFDKRLHDFRVVEQGEKVKVKYSLRNSGDETLVIEEMTASCSCEDATITSNLISPGEEAQLQVTLDTANREGWSFQNVTVHSNDPTQEEVLLRISGIVKTTVKWSPSALSFGEVRNGESREGEIHLVDDHLGKMRVLSVIAPPWILSSTEILPCSSTYDDGLRRYVVKLRVQPKGMVHEAVDSEIRILTSHPMYPSISVPCSAKIVPEIVLKPASIYFGYVRPGKAVSRTVRILASAKVSGFSRVISEDSCIQETRLEWRGEGEYLLCVVFLAHEARTYRGKLALEGEGYRGNDNITIPFSAIVGN